MITSRAAWPCGGARGRPRRASRRARAATRRARRARRRASTSAPSAQPGLADEHDQAGWAGETQRLDGQPLGLDRPLLLELARERLDRVLADLDRAAGAERPAPGPGRHPVGAAAGEPAALGVAHHAQHRQRGRGVVAQPQRPAHRLQLEPQAVRVGLEVAQPGGEPVVRGRAAVLQRGDRRGRPRPPGPASGSNESSRQRAATWSALPGSAREDAGRERHVRRRVMAAPQALGLGLRGRAGRRGGGRAGGPSGLRLGRAWSRPAPLARRSRDRCACTRTAPPTSTSCARCAATFPHPPDVVVRPETRRASCARSSARRPRTSRSRRTAAGRASSAASTRWPAGCRSTSGGSTACSRSTPSRAPRASRPARRAPARGAARRARA